MVTRRQHDEAADELDNFREIARVLRPSSGGIPRLKGVDIYGTSVPLQKETGGDHIIYIDFNQRYDMPRSIAEAEGEGHYKVAQPLRECGHPAAILKADESGHKATDEYISPMLHQALLTLD